MRYFYFIYISLSIFVSSCHKDSGNRPCRDIPDFREDDETLSTGLSPSIEVEPIHFFSPSFHPTDPNEFIFIRQDKIEKTYGIYKYNLATQKQEFIVAAPTNHIIKLMDWSVRDWIVFGDLNAQLWKVKSNGDSLTQLTFQYQNYYPFWSYDGQYLLHYESQKSDGTFLRVRDENMNIVKSYTEKKHFYGDWNKDDLILLSAFGKIQVLDFKTDEIEEIDQIGETTGGICWIPNTTRFIFSGDKNIGLIAMDYMTKEQVQLREYCGTRSYSTPTVSADGQKLLVTRNNIDFDKKMEVTWGELRLYIMDIDGKNERRLELE